MSNFTVETFKSADGIEDPAKVVIKLRRGSVHPGVMARFIAEALGSEDASEQAFGYVRGKLNHMWTVSVEDVEKLKNHMGTFTAETLKAHFATLREAFPKNTVPAPSSDSLLASLKDEDEDEEPESEDEQD